MDGPRPYPVRPHQVRVPVRGQQIVPGGVLGRSMAPTVEDGDRLLVRRVRGTAVRPG